MNRRKFIKSVAGSTVSFPMLAGAVAHSAETLPVTGEDESKFPASLPLHEAESGRVTQHEMALAESYFAAIAPGVDGSTPSETWHDGWLGAALPFSFRYGSEAHDALLAKWPIKLIQSEDSSGKLHDFGWSAPDGFQVRWQVKQFANFPALEWTLWFENVGKSDSAILEDIQDLDLRLRHTKPHEAFQIHGAHGGRYKRDDWQAFSQYLPSAVGGDRDYEDGMQLALGGAYPSSRRHLPFANIETPEERGVVVGVGWTGDWLGNLTVHDQELTAKFGLRATRFRLHSGESVRTAKILVVLWEGKRLHGQNMLRQILHRHYVPELRGQKQYPMVSVNGAFAYGDDGAYLTRANEKNMLPMVEVARRAGAEIFIVDAGWYPGSIWAEWMGNWTYSKDRYPDGFKNLAQACTAANMDFGVWFAPEVVDKTVPLFKEHPEWLSKETTSYGGVNLKLDLPEAREWFLKQVDELAEHQGMTCYRQDGYNSEKNSKEGDTDDRRGIGEIKYMMGYYAMLDAIRARHPNIIMEAAAGAARIDLETLSRFHWHQPCETWLHPDWDQNATCGVSQWLPGGLIIFYDAVASDYSAWSALGGQLSVAIGPRDASFSEADGRKRVDLYKKLRPFLRGDFYPLTANDPEEIWMGYQFHRSDLSSGFAGVFKRFATPKVIHPVPETFTMRLRGVDPQARFKLQFTSGKNGGVVTGETLAKGIEIDPGEAPSAEVVTYEQVG